MSAVRDCLFTIFAATLHTGGRSSIRNLRTCHAVVTLSTCTITYSHHFSYYLDAFQAMAQAVTAETRLRSRASLCDRVGLGQVLLSPVLLFCYPQFFCFPLSVSFHQCSTLCSSEQCSRQTYKPAKPGKPQTKQCFSCRKYFTFCHTRYLSHPFSSHAIKYKCNVAYCQVLYVVQYLSEYKTKFNISLRSVISLRLITAGWGRICAFVLWLVE